MPCINRLCSERLDKMHPTQLFTREQMQVSSPRLELEYGLTLVQFYKNFIEPLPSSVILAKLPLLPIDFIIKSTEQVQIRINKLY